MPQRSGRPSGSDTTARREKQLERRLDRERMPHHVAVIPDGNGRWAQARGVSVRKGHEAGVKAARKLVESCVELKVPVLSFYNLSRDNWTRPRLEVTALLHMLRRFLIDERKDLMKYGIRMIHTGCRDDLPTYVLKALDRCIEMTRDNGGMVLNLALSYSGREEIAEAARRLAREVARGSLRPDDITPDLISSNLYAPEIADPDLLIRTSGERRISDFLTWQVNYAEIHFCEALWPEFGRLHLLEALVDYQSRERRFGGRPS